MARMSWGGAADNSLYFLQLYEGYASRIEDNAQAAIRDAEATQAAKDQDKFNAWRAGEVSDKDWLAYIKQRLSETTDDEEQQTYWKQQLRTSQQQIDSDRIQDGVEEIQAKIDSGDATYDDLLKYLKRERSRVGKDSPLYETLDDSIRDVQGRIQDNATNGEIARAQYLLQSGQISGAQAAAMIRKAAERYKTSDPAKYWQLMSGAYDAQTYGAGGSGGGGGGTSMNSTIDALEYQADAIDLLNEQFNGGKATGTLPDGTEVTLRGGNGDPSPEWESIDNAMVDTLRAMYEAKTANGDRDAVEALSRLEHYITTSVQPRNTIPVERQFGELQRNLAEAVTLADTDPDAGVAAMRQTVARMGQFVDGLNKTTDLTFTGPAVGSEEGAENPELSAARRRQTTRAADDIDQVTLDFVNQASSTVQTYQQALQGQVAPDADALTQALGQTAIVQNGLQTGTWARVQTPDGMSAVPLVPRAVQTPDGPIQQLVPDIKYDDQSQALVQALGTVNGKTEMVYMVGSYQIDPNTNQRVLQLFDGQNMYQRSEGGDWVNLSTGVSTPLPTVGGTSNWQAQTWANNNPLLAQQVLQANGASQGRDLSGAFVSQEAQFQAQNPELAAANRGYHGTGNATQPRRPDPLPSFRGPSPNGPKLEFGGPAVGGAPKLSFNGPSGQSGGLSFERTAQQLGINFQVQNSRAPSFDNLRLDRLTMPGMTPPQLKFNPRALEASLAGLKDRILNMPDPATITGSAPRLGLRPI